MMMILISSSWTTFLDLLKFLFFLVFEFYRKGITNGVQLMCQFLWIFDGPKEDQKLSELGQKSPELPTRVGGAPTPLGAWACLVDSSGISLT